MHLETVRLSKPIGYSEMLARQRERHAEILAGAAPDTLFLLEHKPVFTLGRDAHREHLLCSEAVLEREGIEVVETDRGGDITYHGPGQLVAYPLLDLNRHRPALNWYLRTLEETLIQLLAEYGLRGERVSGRTGVWVNGAKVAAIGIGIRRWITYHGIALNVTPNMRHFQFIVPCGISDAPITSLEVLLGSAPPMPEVMDRYERHFRACFGLSEHNPSSVSSVVGKE